MKLNIRRMDAWNYVIEEVKTAEDTGNEYTRTIGYYASLDALLTDSIGQLPVGKDAKELKASLDEAKKELARAFTEACSNGSLDPVKIEMSEAAREGIRKAREAKREKVSPQA